MNSRRKALTGIVLSLSILLSFQNCGQPGSLAVKSPEFSSKANTDVADEGGMVVEPMDPVTPTQPLPEDPVCEDLDVSEIFLNIAKVKAPSASGATSHLFEIVENDKVVGSKHTLKIKALHTAWKLDKLDLLIARELNTLVSNLNQSVHSLMPKGVGHKVRLFLDRDDYEVTQGRVYELSFDVLADQQTLKTAKNLEQGTLALSDREKQESSNKKSGKKDCSKEIKDECRLHLNLSNGSLKELQ